MIELALTLFAVFALGWVVLVVCTAIYILIRHSWSD